MKRYDVSISNLQFDQIIHQLNDLIAQTDFTRNLEPEERQKMAVMAGVHKDVVEKAIEFANREPLILPPFVHMNVLEGNVDAIKKLDQIRSVVDIIQEAITDTKMLISVGVKRDVNNIYNTIYRARHEEITGIDTMYSELAQYFKKYSNTSNTPENTEPRPILINGDNIIINGGNDDNVVDDDSQEPTL